MFNQTILSVVLVIAGCSFAAAQTCSFSKSGINANWRTVNGSIQIQFQNQQISNNQWTAIAFGSSMQNLQVIIFSVVNGQINVNTGVTTGYAPPTLDNQLSAMVQYVNLSGTTLNAVVTVPISFDGAQLSQCQTWNFVKASPMNNGQIGKHNSDPLSIQNVCPTQC